MLTDDGALAQDFSDEVRVRQRLAAPVAWRQLLIEVDTDIIPGIQSGKCQLQFSADHWLRWILGGIQPAAINQETGLVLTSVGGGRWWWRQRYSANR